MKIEEGKFYRTRDGRKVGPMVWVDHGNSSIWGSPLDQVDPYSSRWCRGGEYYLDKEHEVDLIAEWADEPDAPKTWGEMTDAEKGALLLHEYESENFCIEYSIPEDNDGSWGQKHKSEAYRDDLSYRIRPEPKTVVLYGLNTDGEWQFNPWEKSNDDTHRITFTTTDGKPDLDSIKMEKV